MISCASTMLSVLFLQSKLMIEHLIGPMSEYATECAIKEGVRTETIIECQRKFDHRCPLETPRRRRALVVLLVDNEKIIRRIRSKKDICVCRQLSSLVLSHL